MTSLFCLTHFFRVFILLTGSSSRVEDEDGAELPFIKSGAIGEINNSRSLLLLPQRRKMQLPPPPPIAL